MKALSIRKAYKCYNLRLNKVVESINVTIDEIGRLGSKEEEEAEDEVEEEYEENPIETEEKVQQVSPNTPRK